MIISVIMLSLQIETIHRTFDNFISHNITVFVIEFCNDFLKYDLESF